MFRNSWKQLSLFSRFRPKSTRGKKKAVRKPSKVTASGKSDSYLYGLWAKLIKEYFPHRKDLLRYRVVWSTRNQKRTLASCNVHSQKVIVARELNHQKCYRWLEPLLYHEMCHAVLGDKVPQKNGKHQWHGKEFKALEQRHPEMSPFDAWIKQGGWSRAVRSDRSRRAHQRRKQR